MKLFSMKQSTLSDFYCKSLSDDEFISMTDGIVEFLKRMGYHVETRDEKNNKLKAYRRNIYFPELLFEPGLSGYRQERLFPGANDSIKNISGSVSIETLHTSDSDIP